MKKQLFIFALNLISTFYLTAQITNTFPDNGKVGIGITNPISTLHLYSNSGGNIYNTFFDTNSMNFETPTNGASYINKKDGGSIKFRMGANYNTVMTINNNGYVGIGTTSPTSLLNVGTHTTNSPSSVAQFGISQANGEARVLSLVNSGGGSNQSTSLDFHNGPAWSPTGKIQVQQLGSDTKSKLHFYNYNGGLQNRMTIAETGNVGIGITNPYGKLHVFNQIDGAFNGLIIDNRKIYGANSGINETSRILLSLSENGSPNPLNRVFGIIEAGTLSETDSSNGRLSFHVRQNGNTNEKMRINSSGNLGIGATNPSAKLHVNGTIKGTDYITVDKGGSYRVALNGQSHGYIYGRNDSAENKFLIHSNGNTWFNGGNVGIGTISPSSKLQVEGRTSVGTSGVLSLDWTYETNWGGSAGKWAGYIGFNAYRNNDDTKDNYFGRNKYTSKGAFEGSNYGFRWLFRKDNSHDSDSQHLLSEYMRLDNNGNLGIGTSNPDAKLTVKGNIHTNEVKVDLLGAVAPDYVFYKDYHLKTLTEVENYISKEGHLFT